MKSRAWFTAVFFLVAAVAALHPAVTGPSQTHRIPTVEPLTSAPIPMILAETQPGVPDLAEATRVEPAPPPSQRFTPDTVSPAVDVSMAEEWSPGLAQIIRLAKAETPEGVMLAYVENSGFSFNPSADELVILRGLKVPEPVLVALLKQKRQPTTASAAVASVNAASPAPAAAGAAVPVQVTQTVNVQSPPLFYPSMAACATFQPLGSYVMTSPSGRFRVYNNVGTYCDAPVLVVGPRSFGPVGMRPFEGSAWGPTLLRSSWGASPYTWHAGAYRVW